MIDFSQFKSFGDYMRRQREAAGFSLRGMEKESGVGFTTIHRIEKDQIAPILKTVFPLAAALRVSVVEILEAYQYFNT